jgi:hypothetical protein
MKNLSKHIITFFSNLAPIHINNHAYSLVGIYSEKTVNKHKWHKWHKLYFTQQQRTYNNGLVFKCIILHKIIVRCIKNFASCRISGLIAVRNKC